MDQGVCILFIYIIILLKQVTCITSQPSRLSKVAWCRSEANYSSTLFIFELLFSYWSLLNSARLSSPTCFKYSTFVSLFLTIFQSSASILSDITPDHIFFCKSPENSQILVKLGHFTSLHQLSPANNDKLTLPEFHSLSFYPLLFSSAYSNL